MDMPKVFKIGSTEIEILGHINHRYALALCEGEWCSGTAIVLKLYGHHFAHKFNVSEGVPNIAVLKVDIKIIV